MHQCGWFWLSTTTTSPEPSGESPNPGFSDLNIYKMVERERCLKKRQIPERNTPAVEVSLLESTDPSISNQNVVGLANDTVPVI